jgi:PAS domain S-box-containing protein
MEPSAYRERIYEIFADSDEALKDKTDRALQIGTRYLDLPIGFLTRINDGIQEIVHATGDHPLIQPNETCPLDEAYCRRTVEIDEVLAVQDAAISTAISDTAVETFDLGTYIGAKILVDDEIYGTVCFADEDQRSEAFTDAEGFFVELLARLIGQAIERRDYRRELAEREAELNEQAEIYRAVIDASFDFVFRTDVEGRFTYNSATVTDFLGYTPAELDGQPITVVRPDEQTPDRVWNLVEQILAGESVEARNLPLETKSGRIVYADIRGTPIYDGTVSREERTLEDIVAIQGMTRDATDRRQREGLISVINRVLRHNLRNEMTIISGYADMLEAELDGEAASRAEHIGATADRLLDLSEAAQRIEENRDLSADLEPMDIAPLVDRVASQLKTRSPDATVAVKTPDTAVAETLPRVEIALWELVDNAAKHGGDLPSLEIEVRSADRWIVVAVTDNGPGLPDTEREVLESGKETPLVHGQGLGLWLVYWIVTNLNGEIEATEIQQGTTVEIRLPRPS